MEGTEEQFLWYSIVSVEGRMLWHREKRSSQANYSLQFTVFYTLLASIISLLSASSHLFQQFHKQEFFRS